MHGLLPNLSTDVALEPHCIAESCDKDHSVVRDLATEAEIAAYRPELLEAAPRACYDHRPLEERDACGRAFLQMPNLWRRDPVFWATWPALRRWLPASPVRWTEAYWRSGRRDRRSWRRSVPVGGVRPRAL